MAAIGLVLATVLIAGCSGGSSETEVAAVDPQAERDLRALEQAREGMLSDCRDLANVEVTDAFTKAVRVIANRPEEELPNGKTPRSMADEIIVDIKECGATNAEFVEMMLIPSGSETSFETERQERDQILSGDIRPDQELFRNTCQAIAEEGEEAARQDFIDNTLYVTAEDLAEIHSAFDTLAAQC